MGQLQRPGDHATFSAAEQAKLKQAIRIDDYRLVNARVALQGFEVSGADATLALWGRNIFDDKSMSYSDGIGNLAFPPIFEMSRTYGVDLTIAF